MEDYPRVTTHIDIPRQQIMTHLIAMHHDIEKQIEEGINIAINNIDFTAEVEQETYRIIRELIRDRAKIIAHSKILEIEELAQNELNKQINITT